jgi:hypothetical protein
LPYPARTQFLLRDQELRVVEQLLRDAATAYDGDIVLLADLARVAVPPGRDASAALTSRHSMEAISTPAILPLVRHALAGGAFTKFLQ